MKKYRITVNGKTFDVDVEEVGGAMCTKVAADPAPQPARVTPPPPVTPAMEAPRQSAPPASKPAVAAAGANVMKSPLPGKILKVHATPGSSWKKGDTLLVIEAMKMENEILAPRDCVVEEVAVESNQSVKTGDLLLKLR
jgi:biotin carboxyl carrier protein